MALDRQKAPATIGTVMPTMGGVTENDDEDEIDFDDDMEFESIE